MQTGAAGENMMLSGIRAAAARIENTASILGNEAVLAAGGDQRAAEGGFLASMQQAVRAVDDKAQHARNLAAEVDSGRSDDLVGAMLASQEASLSFSMLMQVRNKVVGAVDEVLKLQV